MSRSPVCTFAKDEHAAQIAYFNEHFTDVAKHKERPFQLARDDQSQNLLPAVRAQAVQVFKDLNIQFHTFVGHGRSSQACCINFLMPFADKPELLSRWIGGLLGIAPPQMLQIEKEVAGDYRYVAFEYTGPDDKDFLDEADGRVPGRGANATAADAAVAFVDADGVRHLLLIEWKYTEEYRTHRLSEDKKGKRHSRYADKLLAPNGPVRSDLGLTLDGFLYEPFYQLARQQMLAWQIEKKSDRFDRVRVLHLSPSGNKALHSVTSPKFAELAEGAYTDAFDSFRSCLVDPGIFVDCSIEAAFAPIAQWPDADWWEGLAARYQSLCSVGRGRGALVWA